MASVNPPRGMRDFLPAEKARRERVLAVIRERYAAHGFDEIETPVVEEYSRLHAGIGGDNEKLAYNVLKRGLDADGLRAAADDGAVDISRLADLGLRYDLTVPLARFYASHRAELPTVFRSIQSAPVWRAERPQKGRYRQFVQCDIDIMGDPSSRAEAELIVATLDTVDALGLEGATVRINDRRALDWMLDGFGFTAQERPGVLITIDKLDKVGPEGVIAELRARAHRQAQGPDSPAQGPDSQGQGPDSPAQGPESRGQAPESQGQGPESPAQGPESQGQAPESRAQGPESAAVDALEAFLRRPMTLEYNPYGERQIRKLLPPEAPDEIVAHLVQIGEAVAAATASADIPLVFDPFLVRGMGYYTGTIFELAHPSVEYSLGGGGRYDGMIGRFLGQDVPAVGFSIGFERIVDLVEGSTDAAAAAVVLVHDRDVPLGELLALKATLVGQGSRVRLEQRTKNLKALLERAASDGYTAFATVSAGTTSETLEVKPLG